MPMHAAAFEKSSQRYDQRRSPPSPQTSDEFYLLSGCYCWAMDFFESSSKT